MWQALVIWLAKLIIEHMAQVLLKKAGWTDTLAHLETVATHCAVKCDMPVTQVTLAQSRNPNEIHRYDR